MTLPIESAALGLKDTKIFGWSGSDYNTTGYDVPKVTQVEVGPVVASKELEGDDSVDVNSYIKNYEGKLAFQKISLQVLQTIFGGSLLASGSTPNQKQAYTFPETGTSLGKFKLIGQCTKVDSGLGDAILTVSGCKVKSGTYPITLSYDNYASITVDIFVSDQPVIELNETATAISASTDTTAPTVQSTIPADNASNIVISDNLTCTFSEAIQEGSVISRNFILMKASDGTIIDGALSLGTNNTVVTFNPTANLVAGTAYIWLITNVRDIVGNTLAVPTVVNFTTAA